MIAEGCIKDMKFHRVLSGRRRMNIERKILAKQNDYLWKIYLLVEQELSKQYDSIIIKLLHKYITWWDLKRGRGISFIVLSWSRQLTGHYIIPDSWNC